jgi:iron complex outermembrane receptor protein
MSCKRFVVTALAAVGTPNQTSRDSRISAMARRGLLGLTCLLIGSPDYASQCESHCAATPLAFHVEPADADVMVTELSQQAGVQVLFDFKVLHGRHTNPVEGAYTLKDALKRCLAGSDLDFQFVNDRTLAVMARKHGLASLFSSLKQVFKSKPPPPPPVLDLGDPAAAGAYSSQVTLVGLREIPTSTVTAIGAEVMSFSRADVDGPGRTTLEDFVTSVPQIFGGGPSDHTYRGIEAISNFGLGTGVNIRGQDASASDVRLDGLPLPGSGTLGAFTDLTAIPHNIVDHIDLVPDGSSVLYDGASVGGLFNIVSRAPTHGLGLETDALVGTGIGGIHTADISVFASDTWEIGAHPAGFLFSVEYYNRTALPANARVEETQNLTSLGGSDWRSSFCSPGTIVSGNQSWAIPSVPAGALTASQLVAGTVNRCNRLANTDVLPSDQRVSFFLRGNATLTADLDVWAEALIVDRRASASAPSASATLSVPAQNPFYVAPKGTAFGAPVSIQYNFDSVFGPTADSIDNVTGVFAAGGVWHSRQDWTVTGYVEYANVDAMQTIKNMVDPGALNQVLNDAQSSWDPYSSHNPLTEVSFARAQSSYRAESSLETAQVSATGPVASLAGGKASLTVGMQYRAEQLLTVNQPPTAENPLFVSTAANARSTFARNMASYFGQLEVPVVGADNRVPGVFAAAASAGVRRQDFNDVGGVTVPQFGVSWSPLESLRARATWSESLVPPALPALSQSGNVSAIYQFPDTRSPTGTTTALLYTGGNPSLRPERAREWSAGLDWALPGFPLKLSGTLFQIQFADRILPPQTISYAVLTNPIYGYLVTRDPTTSEIDYVCTHSTFSGTKAACTNTAVGALIDLETANAASLFTRGVDLGGRYTYTAGRSTVTAALDGTYLLDYNLQNTPGGPVYALRNTAEEPLALRARGSLDWRYGSFGIGVAVNFASAYHDINTVPFTDVGASTTVDLQYRQILIVGERGNDLALRVDVRNVGNSAPPFYNNPNGRGGVDPENGSIEGRIVTARVEKRW